MGKNITMMWDGKKKAVTFSYDDGVMQDRRLVELMNQYGIKGTFNLNSGNQSYSHMWENQGVMIHAMNVDGLKELYHGHEIAVHGLTHADLPKFDQDTIRNEIQQDKKNLEQMFDQPIVGMAYPFGTYNDEVLAVAESCGIKYARTVERTGTFELPENPLTLHPTCHHGDEDVLELIDQFLALETDRPQLFYLWGHSYEFDVDHNWDRLEKILQKLSGHDDIYYGTNAQVLNLLPEEEKYPVKGIIFDMDGVLVNTEPLHYRAWKEAFKDFGVDLDYEIYKPCIGTTRSRCIEIMKNAYGDRVENYESMSQRMEEKKKTIVEREGYPLCDGIREGLRRLKEAGYRLAVGSSSPADVIHRVTKAVGIDEFFSCFISGEQVAHPKPAPDTFLEAAKGLQLDPKECVIIEDSTNGGRAAKAAGIPCIWFHNPDSGDQQIPDALLEISSWTEENTEKILKVLSQK